MRPMIVKLAAAAVCLVFAAALDAAQFIHNPVLSGPAGEDIDVQAALIGADTGNVQVRLYYRLRGMEIYRSVVMGGPLSSLDGTIPGSIVDVPGIEYYIEADQYNGAAKNVITYPASNPEINPIEVVVRKDDSAPVVEALSPADGETVDSSEPVITAGFSDPNGAIDSSSVVVKLDGSELRGSQVQVYDTLVSFVPAGPLSDGAHAVSVSVANKGGHTGTLTWSFTVAASASQTKQPVKRPWSYDGKVSAETMYGAVLKQPSLYTTSFPYRIDGDNRLWVEANARGDEDTVSLKAYVTDEERSDQQPLDRYTATWTNREGQLAVGDVNPSFSELSLLNPYWMRGFDFNLLSGPADGGHTRFDGVWGQTVRAVNAGGVDISGNPLQATFSQYLYGARWEAGNPYFMLGLNAVTINDDDTSLSNPGSTVPDFNTIFSSDAKVGVPQVWLKFNGEVAFDYYAANESVLGLSLGSAYIAGAVWDARPLGTKLAFEWKDTGGFFTLPGGGSGSNSGSGSNNIPIPGGFSTMANPGLLSDYRGFESSLTQTLYSGVFSFSASEDNWRDNLDGDKPTTTFTNYLNALTTIAPGPSLPYLSLDYSQTNIYNSGSIEAVDSLGNTGTEYADSLTEVYNAALGYNLRLDKASNLALNVSYVGTELTDMAEQRNMQNLDSWNLVLSGVYGRGNSSFNLNVGVGGSTNPAAFALQDLSTTGLALGYLPNQNSNDLSVGARWDQRWDTSPFSSFVGWNLQQTDAGTDAGVILSNQINDSVRDTFSLGGAYKMGKQQKLGLTFDYSLVSLSDNAGQGLGTISDSLAELYTDLRYDLSF